MHIISILASEDIVEPS